MKSLSLGVPHIVVMVGVPGSGKSFFADHFAETFHAPLVSWNAIRAELFNEPTYSKDEDEIVDRVGKLLLGEMVKTGATIIFEGATYTQTARQELTKAAKAAGYNVLYVWVQTDTATTAKRAKKAGMPPGVHESYTKRFTSLKESDNHVVISGKHTYASQLKVVLRRLSRTVDDDRTPERPAAPVSSRQRSGRILIR